MRTKKENLLGLAYVAKKIIIGSDECIEAIKNNKVFLVYLDKNTNTNIEKQLIKLCESHNVVLDKTLSSEELSHSIGLKNIKVIGVIDKGFSTSMMKSQEK